jgi:acetyl-CoA/propionyl-CoA carboxylase, biotin carboxylase, biotin carboxyl carrier protein
LRYTEDPVPRGHSIEFRINGEDAGRNFLPAPGTVTRFVAPEGPGVRTDTGVESGTVIGGQFDSLLAKVIVTGSDRNNALARARRALDEMVVEGMATVLPFHRAIVRDPAFVGDDTGFSVHTRWIETEFDNTIPPFVGTAEATEPEARQNVVVEVGGRRLEVSLPANLAAVSSGAGASAAKAAPRRRSGGKSAAASGDAVTAPMQGTIVKIGVEDGQQVEAGELIVVLEAMKMENPVTAHKSGTVTGLAVGSGETVTQGTILCEIKD